VELLIAENVVAWRGSRYAKAWKPLRAVFIPSYLSFGHSVLIGRYFSEDSNKLSNKKQENVNLLKERVLQT
jgi:hypothetical protein